MGKINCCKCRKDVTNENTKSSKLVTGGKPACEKCYDKMKMKNGKTVK